MRKAGATIVLVLAFLIGSKAGTVYVNIGTANLISIKPPYAEISIWHPQERTYNDTVLALNFTVKTNADPSLTVYSYIMDRTENATISNVRVTGSRIVYDDPPVWIGGRPADPHYYYWPYAEYSLEGEAVLSGLSDGAHDIMVYQGSFDDFHHSGTVRFVIDATPENDDQSEFSVPTAMATVAAFAMAAAILCLVFLVYRRKRHREVAQS